MARKRKPNYIYAIGRRKSASARVRLFRGKGENIINGKPLAQYFPTVVDKDKWTKPFRITETTGKYYVSVKVVGGGKGGQLDAVIHGIARALAQANEEEYRRLLKKEGLLTRDARIRERRKVGTGGKARRKKQSPKR